MNTSADSIAKDGHFRTENRRQKTEDRSQKTEVRRQKTEML